MTDKKMALRYFKNLREQKVKDYSMVLDAAPKGSVVYETVSAEIEIYDIVIKSLEQESVLDKIRAEIEWLKLHRAQFLTYDNKVCIDSQAVLDIIDKYRK